MEAFFVAALRGPVFGAALVTVPPAAAGLRVRAAGFLAVPVVADAVLVVPEVRRLRDAVPDVGSTVESLRAAESAAATWALSLRALESLRGPVAARSSGETRPRRPGCPVLSPPRSPTSMVVAARPGDGIRVPL
ncbi:hypothetical protein GCM10025792_53910 [Pseudonocardia tropica]